MKRKELLNALEKVKPGIESKEMIESMTYFFFSGTDIVSYNDKISIQHPFKTDFSLFVKANDLYRIIAKLKTDTVKITERNNKLNIKCNTLNANLNTIEDDEFIERINNVQKSLKKVKWKNLPDNFQESISLCSFVASSQESDQLLTFVKLEGDYCISSDNRRISKSLLNSPIDLMFIKASEIKNLIAINPIKYSIQKSWIHFKNEDNCIFSLRMTSGEFPDFLQFFDFDGTTISLPKNIIEGMNIASVFADDVDPAIYLKISKGYVIVSIKSEAGSIQHRSKIDHTGEDIEFSINPEFLKQMMSHSSSIIVSDDKAKLETDDKSFSLVTALYN